VACTSILGILVCCCPNGSNLSFKRTSYIVSFTTWMELRTSNKSSCQQNCITCISNGFVPTLDNLVRLRLAMQSLVTSTFQEIATGNLAGRPNIGRPLMQGRGRLVPKSGCR